MKIDERQPPRRFSAGRHSAIELSDCGSVSLSPDEMVTFVTESGGEYDVCRKSWGFYATPSINGRLAGFGFRTALTRNDMGRYFVMLVEKAQISSFMGYLHDEQMELVEWLDER